MKPCTNKLIKVEKPYPPRGTDRDRSIVPFRTNDAILESALLVFRARIDHPQEKSVFQTEAAREAEDIRKKLDALTHTWHQRLPWCWKVNSF